MYTLGIKQLNTANRMSLKLFFYKASYSLPPHPPHFILNYVFHQNIKLIFVIIYTQAPKHQLCHRARSSTATQSDLM